MTYPRSYNYSYIWFFIYIEMYRNFFCQFIFVKVYCWKKGNFIHAYKQTHTKSCYLLYALFLIMLQLYLQCTHKWSLLMNPLFVHLLTMPGNTVWSQIPQFWRCVFFQIWSIVAIGFHMLYVLYAQFSMFPLFLYVIM